MNEETVAPPHSVYALALNDWRTLNNVLYEFREDQVLAMLEVEKTGKRRRNVLERLHARYNSLRVARERIEVLGTAL